MSLFSSVPPLPSLLDDPLFRWLRPSGAPAVPRATSGVFDPPLRFGSFPPIAASSPSPSVPLPLPPSPPPEEPPFKTVRRRVRFRSAAAPPGSVPTVPPSRPIPCCFHCLKPGHLVRQSLSDVVCKKCRKPGHVLKNCPLKPRAPSTTPPPPSFPSVHLFPTSALLSSGILHSPTPTLFSSRALIQLVDLPPCCHHFDALLQLTSSFGRLLAFEHLGSSPHCFIATSSPLLIPSALLASWGGDSFLIKIWVLDVINRPLPLSSEALLTPPAPLLDFRSAWKELREGIDSILLCSLECHRLARRKPAAGAARGAPSPPPAEASSLH